MPAHTAHRRVLATALAIGVATLLLTPLLGLLGTPAANAAVYRYWGYFHGNGNGGWTFASKGPASYVPKNEAVEGWRFADVGKQSRFPRTKSSYDAVCPATLRMPYGTKAVAVYLDFGLASEAPSGQTPPRPLATCVVTSTKATGAQVLAQAAKVRTQKGLTCAIDNYPASGCGDQVTNAPKVKLPEPSVQFDVVRATATGAATTHPTPSAGAPAATAPTQTSHTLRYVLIAVLVAVVLGLGGAFAAGRKRP